jgi:hypothetical protein
MDDNTNNYKLKEISNIFFIVTFISLLINLYLFLKCKNIYIKFVLSSGIIIELLTLYSIIKENQVILTILDQLFLIFLWVGCIFFDKIYLCFIIYLIIIAFISREIFDVCFYESYAPKGMNGTLTIFVISVIILYRVIFLKLFPNLLKF